jgi:tripartite-type tricarboxylate transporter receptor subunit TctC
MKRGVMALVLALTAMAGPAIGQTFPSKEIRFVNGFPAGGTSDIIGRVLAEQLTRQLGKSGVVDNKAGASGMIAAADTAKSPPDGHTILLA